jgi:hypothetical protein
MNPINNIPDKIKNIDMTNNIAFVCSFKGTHKPRYDE